MFCVIPLSVFKQIYAPSLCAGKAKPFGKMKIISTLQVVFFSILALPTLCYSGNKEHKNSIVMNYKTSLPELTFKYKRGDFEKATLKSSYEAADFFRKLYDADLIEYREEMILLLLNRANTTIGFIKISSGGLTGTVCDSRMVFAAALKSGATGIMLSHNHPSGNTKPSDADIKLTALINTGAKTLDINLLDHIIITQSSYYSFADEGLIK